VKLQLLEFIAKLLGDPLGYLLVHWFFIPIGLLFQLQYDFLTWFKPVGGPQRNEDIFAQQERTGQDRTGQDRSGQGRTGTGRTG
jgi:hypothetical protein